MSVVNSARDVHVDEILDAEPHNWLNMKEVPAWFISLGVHLLILFILASITRITLLDSEHAIISSIEELDQNVFEVDPTIQDVVGTAGETDILSPSMAAAPETSKEQQEAMQSQLENEIETPEPVFDDEITQPAEEELTAAVEVTGETDRPGGVAGAIDRLTLEIAAAAKEKKLLVVWLFDVSPSVSERRNEIADRFENVYKQLGILDITENENSVKTAVAAFGATTQILTKDPVSDVKEVVSQIRSIKTDMTGDENVFAAVTTVSKRWLSYKKKGRRNMMVIVVTDEAGTDAEKNLEETILLTKRNGIKCYVVGDAAPFGQREVTRMFPIDGVDVPAVSETGPETVAPERIKLPFWGQSSNDIRELSSGYGPYGLTRLCAETNGIYFITQDTAGPKFEAADMRGYHPDYISIRDYEKKVSANSAKTALVRTAMATMASKRRLPTPTLEFPANNDNILRQAITEAQKPVSELDYGLNELQVMLEQGLKDRKKITEPRWRANYDLALGRVLAIRVRAYGYNTILADMKSSPKSFEKPKVNNAWRLEPSKDVRSSPSVRKLGKQATELLNGVIDEHPGTPWAFLAAKELDKPLGWTWKEIKLNLDAQGKRIRTPNPRFEEDQRKRREALKKRGIDSSKPLKI